MRDRVLITAPYLQPVLDRYRAMFDDRRIELLVPPVTERLDERELLDLVPGAHGFICGDDQFTERVLRAATDLRVLSKWGTGIDSIDRDACQRLGIAICNTPGAFTEPVADSVLGYMLCFARRLPWMNDAISAGHWKKPECRALNECSLGVIGVGNIGKAVIRRARAFGMRVLGNDTAPIDSKFVAESELQVLTRSELLRQSDFVTLHCDLNQTSLNLMGPDEFAQMKPSAVLINLARGPIVDQPALVRALRNGNIDGAALDVFVDEPLPNDSPLRRMPNVMLAPHNSNSSTNAWHRVNLNSIANLLQELERTRNCSVQH